jgi:non-canonical (house-cleaning) NTP pyrophosphatase
MESPKLVVLGSGSAIKIEATEAALTHLLAAGIIHFAAVVDAVSGVRPQPVGQAETLQGARNRAHSAAAARHDTNPAMAVSYAIGIENGMWEEQAGDPTTLVDAAFVVCLVLDPVLDARKGSEDKCGGSTTYSVVEEFVEMSDVLPIPAIRPFPRGRYGEWSAIKDPHEVLTNGLRPRKLFLIPPLERIAARIVQHMNATGRAVPQVSA